LDYHHRFENRYGLPGAGGPRQPLERSTGNVQLRHTPTLPSTGPAYSSSQQQHLDAYSTIQSSIPTPPVIPSQVFSSVYGPQPAQPATRVPERRRTHHVATPYYPNVPMTLLMMTRNPLARAPQFANYRAKQDSDKASGASSRGDKKQKWPDVLEAACLDGKTPNLRGWRTVG
jgi:transcriptional enhancer factor